jgi:hypothetical protein
MSKLKFKSLLTMGTALAGLTLLATAPAFAASTAAASAKARYLRDIEHCRTIGEHDARANCLSEASTAYAQTQPSAPQENATQLASNAMRRCDPLPKPDHDDCVARINGAGTVSGTVAGGGILRELVTREVVAQAPSTVVPNPLPPTGAGPTPPPQSTPQPAVPGAKPAQPPIEPAPADTPPMPPRPPGS